MLLQATRLLRSRQEALLVSGNDNNATKKRGGNSASSVRVNPNAS